MDPKDNFDSQRPRPTGTGRTSTLMQFGEFVSRHRAANLSFSYRSGPFIVRLRCNYRPTLQLLALLYAEAEVLQEPAFADFHIRLMRPHGLRRWWRPQIQFVIDREALFEPYPLHRALPMIEWGVNYCISTQAHYYLMLHAGAVEQNGQAVLFPAMPGSGKSTLCTALQYHGWRLLSDEFGLIQPDDGRVHPLPRAIPLKNASIAIIRGFAPEAVFGPEFHGTRKGTVAHVKPTADSLTRQTETAVPRWVLFPRYRAGSDTHLEPIARSLAFSRLAQNSFNYSLKGRTGFQMLERLIRSCDCFSLTYSDLDQAIAAVGQLQDETSDKMVGEVRP